MSDAKIVSLADLPVAVAAAGTDSFAVCQSPSGCGPQDNLAQMTLAQLSSYILAQVQPVPPAQQYVSEIIPQASAVPLVASGGVYTVASVDLPPGEWLLTGEIWFEVISGNASNVGRLVALMGPTTVMAAVPTDPADDLAVSVAAPQNAGVGIVLPLSQIFIQNTGPGTVTYYLIASAQWTGGVQLVAFGKISGLYRPAA